MAGNLFFLRGWTITLIGALLALFSKGNNSNYIIYSWQCCAGSVSEIHSIIATICICAKGVGVGSNNNFVRVPK